MPHLTVVSVCYHVKCGDKLDEDGLSLISLAAARRQRLTQGYYVKKIVNQFYTIILFISTVFNMVRWKLPEASWYFFCAF
ncbi:hypothetical protein ACH3XW_4410 [Acanthocheilonema viteae]